MPEVTKSGQSRAEAALFAELEQLYARAGRPSTRNVAREIGGISHTTVHAALRGTSVPTWPVLQKIVVQLGGDIETFRQLWSDTQDRPAPRPEQVNSDFAVFVSYAHIDDTATYKRISQIIEGFANVYESLTGQAVGVFRDVKSIKPGDDWRDRIRLGLSASSIFFAFISPAYLRSSVCREELSEFLAFLDANSSSRLIVPLLFASPDRLFNDFANDELWMRLAKLQWLDISSLRVADPGSSAWITALNDIADRTDEVLRSLAPNKTDTAQPEPEQTPEADEPGETKFERMAAIEARLPANVMKIQHFSDLMATLGREVEAAAPEMAQAGTFAKKLIVSEELADKLDPIAAEMQDVSKKMASYFDDLTFMVKFGLDAIRNNPDNVEPEIITLLRTILETATSGAQSLSAIDGFIKSMGGAIGYSKRLDKPLKEIREACLRVADLRGIFSGWQEELRVADDLYPQVGLLSDLSETRKPEVDENRAQTKRIFIWEERLDRDPRISQVQAAVAGSENRPVVVAHLRNASEWPIYDVRLSWHKGSAPWGEPDRFPVLLPGDETSAIRALPDLPSYVDPILYGAVAFFRDTNQVTWRARPDGVLDEIPAGQEVPS